MAGPGAKLIGQKEPVKDQEVVCGGPVTVGRDPTSNSLPINHPSISRKHGRIFQEGTAWNVEDLGSSNGTFLNEVRIQKVRLKDGDVVRFGDVPFKFQMARPEPVAAASGGGGEGFEPTIMISPANRPKVDAPPPSDFEGTVFGGQAPVFFANQMQKDQSQQASNAGKVATADAPPPVYVPPPVQTPNMFMLKLKAIIGIVIFFSLIAIGVMVIIRNAGKSQEIRTAVKESRMKVEDFLSQNESRVLLPEAVLPTFKSELEVLEACNKELKEKLEKFKDGDKEQVDNLKALKERVDFLIFERKEALAVAEGDRAATDNLVQDLAVNGTENQKALAPLAKELLKLQHFRKKFPLNPDRSVEAPDPKDIDSLLSAVATLKTEHEKNAGNQLLFNTHFSRMVKNSIDNDEFLIRLWQRFYTEYEAAKAEKDAERRKDKIERLNRDYSSLNLLKDLK
ncbi:MAG: FHA domain-containing protein [Planctomycetota bacterium]|nr:FHA domain-containing protein [Planctomycetota bacterium]